MSEDKVKKADRKEYVAPRLAKREEIVKITGAAAVGEGEMPGVYS